MVGLITLCSLKKSNLIFNSFRIVLGKKNLRLSLRSQEALLLPVPWCVVLMLRYRVVPKPGSDTCPRSFIGTSTATQTRSPHQGEAGAHHCPLPVRA
jgi:hypothetical protein